MSSKVSHKFPAGWGKSDAFTLHPVLNHQMARYYLCALVLFLLLPHRLLLGNASLSPPLPCWVTDGFSCRQTITAEAFGCIPFVLVGKQNSYMEMVMFYACFIVCLVTACMRKEYSHKINFIEFSLGTTWRAF